MRNEVKLANPNYDSSKIEEFKNVWVFCEQRQGQMMSTSYELISEGRKLADELGREALRSAGRRQCRRSRREHWRLRR